MEEPTSPDDILGHGRIRREAAPVRIATGEHCHNSVMFKQLLQSGAIDVCQIDSCRVAGGQRESRHLVDGSKIRSPRVPTCRWSWSVRIRTTPGFVRFSGCFLFDEDRVIEYVDHLHEHFVDPVVITRGRYMLPQQPGYSCEIRSASLERFAFRMVLCGKMKCAKPISFRRCRRCYPPRRGRSNL